MLNTALKSHSPLFFSLSDARFGSILWSLLGLGLFRTTQVETTSRANDLPLWLLLCCWTTLKDIPKDSSAGLISFSASSNNNVEFTRIVLHAISHEYTCMCIKYAVPNEANYIYFFVRGGLLLPDYAGNIVAWDGSRGLPDLPLTLLFGE